MTAEATGPPSTDPLHGPNPPHGPDLRAAITQRLARLARQEAPADGLRSAAVATVVISTSIEHRHRAESNPSTPAGLLLTRRSGQLRNHSGQSALPGGRLDDGEDAVTAALREVREEVGLAMGRNSVLGLLDDYVTRSGYRITPVVVWCDSLAGLEANPAEVASVHEVPLCDICHDSAPTLLTDDADQHESFCLDLHSLSTRIHAPTAAVLHQFAEVCIAGRMTRVGHLDQPRFAWR